MIYIVSLPNKKPYNLKIEHKSIISPDNVCHRYVDWKAYFQGCEPFAEGVTDPDTEENLIYECSEMADYSLDNPS